MLPVGGAPADAPAEAQIGRASGLWGETFRLPLLRGSGRRSRVSGCYTIVLFTFCYFFSFTILWFKFVIVNYSISGFIELSIV